MLNSKGLYFALVFGASLSSYYFYGLAVSVDHPISLMAIGVLAAMSLTQRTHAHRGITLAIFLSALSTFWLFVPYLSGQPVHFKGYAAICIGLTICGVLFDSFRNGAISFARFQKIVEVCLLIHTIAFALQYGAYQWLGITLDFLSWLTGEEQRTFGGEFFGVSAFRAAGLFNEPGTYCVHVAGLVLMIAALSVRSGRFPIFMVALSALSMVLSFSAFGIAAGALAFAVMLLRSVRSVRALPWLLVVLTIAAVAIGLVQDFLLDYLTVRFFSGSPDASVLARMAVVDYVFSRDTSDIMLGEGFVVPDIAEDVPISDASVAIDALRAFGITGALGIAYLVYASMRTSLIVVPLLAAVLGSKLAISHPFLWVVLATLVAACSTARPVQDSRKGQRQ